MAEVETSRDGGVLTITLNRPDVLNAFTAELHKQLVGAFGAFALEFDGRNTARGLAGSGIVCPPVTDALLRTYVTYFIRSGFLEAPITHQRS